MKMDNLTEIDQLRSNNTNTLSFKYFQKLIFQNQNKANLELQQLFNKTIFTNISYHTLNISFSDNYDTSETLAKFIRSTGKYQNIKPGIFVFTIKNFEYETIIDNINSIIEKHIELLSLNFKYLDVKSKIICKDLYIAINFLN
jgi:hypothetical protein